jgi:hypothetical protein
VATALPGLTTTRPRVRGETADSRHRPASLALQFGPACVVRQRMGEVRETLAQLQFGPACGERPLGGIIVTSAGVLQFGPACGVRRHCACAAQVRMLLQFGPACVVRQRGAGVPARPHRLQFGPACGVRPGYAYPWRPAHTRAQQIMQGGMRWSGPSLARSRP